MKLKTLAVIVIVAGGGLMAVAQMRKPADPYQSSGYGGGSSVLGQVAQWVGLPAFGGGSSGGSDGSYQDASADGSAQGMVGDIQRLSDRSTWVNNTIQHVMRMVEGN
ncbi:MAG: hypothetical protein KGL12_14110 [Rhodospirillales bacterium]|nr:hypothetical protein [Rhodospirillales bacterium]